MPQPALENLTTNTVFEGENLEQNRIALFTWMALVGIALMMLGKPILHFGPLILRALGDAYENELNTKDALKRIAFAVSSGFEDPEVASALIYYLDNFEENPQDVLQGNGLVHATDILTLLTNPQQMFEEIDMRRLGSFLEDEVFEGFVSDGYENLADAAEEFGLPVPSDQLTYGLFESSYVGMINEMNDVIHDIGGISMLLDKLISMRLEQLSEQEVEINWETFLHETESEWSELVQFMDLWVNTRSVDIEESMPEYIASDPVVRAVFVRLYQSNREIKLRFLQERGWFSAVGDNAARYDEDVAGIITENFNKFVIEVLRNEELFTQEEFELIVMYVSLGNLESFALNLIVDNNLDIPKEAISRTIDFAELFPNESPNVYSSFLHRARRDVSDGQPTPFGGISPDLTDEQYIDVVYTARAEGLGNVSFELLNRYIETVGRSQFDLEYLVNLSKSIGGDHEEPFNQTLWLLIRLQRYFGVNTGEGARDFIDTRLQEYLDLAEELGLRESIGFVYLVNYMERYPESALAIEYRADARFLSMFSDWGESEIMAVIYAIDQSPAKINSIIANSFSLMENPVAAGVVSHYPELILAYIDMREDGIPMIHPSPELFNVASEVSSPFFFHYGLAPHLQPNYYGRILKAAYSNEMFTESTEFFGAISDYQLGERYPVIELSSEGANFVTADNVTAETGVASASLSINFTGAGDGILWWLSQGDDGFMAMDFNSIEEIGAESFAPFLRNKTVLAIDLDGNLQVLDLAQIAEENGIEDGFGLLAYISPRYTYFQNLPSIVENGQVRETDIETMLLVEQHPYLILIDYPEGGLQDRIAITTLPPGQRFMQGYLEELASYYGVLPSNISIVPTDPEKLNTFTLDENQITLTPGSNEHVLTQFFLPISSEEIYRRIAEARVSD